jgi:hypothetical protein
MKRSRYCEGGKKPPLVIDFLLESDSSVHTKCSVVEVLEDKVTLSFAGGTIAGQLALPLKSPTKLRCLTPADMPFPIRQRYEPTIAALLEFRFSIGGDGCMITEFKPGTVVIVSPFGFFTADTLPSA